MLSWLTGGIRRIKPKQHHGNGRCGSPAVLLEALHTNFHPAFRKFLGLIEPTNVIEVHATLQGSRWSGRLVQTPRPSKMKLFTKWTVRPEP